MASLNTNSTGNETGDDDRYVIEPVVKALDILRLMAAAREPMRLKDVSASICASNTTVFRHLKTLVAAGAICSDNRNLYYINLSFADGLAHAATFERLRQVAYPLMEQLSTNLECTANLGVMRKSHIVYLDMCGRESMISMRARIGGGDPIHTTAIGKAILAHLPPELLDKLLPPVLRRRTEASVTDRRKVQDELDEVRARGFAWDRHENEEGLSCVGAPIFSGKYPLAALSVTMTAERAAAIEDELVAMIVAACRHISAEIKSPIDPESFCA